MDVLVPTTSLQSTSIHITSQHDDESNQTEKAAQTSTQIKLSEDNEMSET